MESVEGCDDGRSMPTDYRAMETLITDRLLFSRPLFPLTVSNP